MGQLVAALGASHNPHFLMPVERWEEVFDVLSPTGVPDFVRKGETLEQAREALAFSQECFKLLRDQLYAGKPDSLIIIANDQAVNFFSFIPAFAVYVGARAGGRFGEHAFDYACDQELAEGILEEAMEQGFDVTLLEEIRLQHSQDVPLYYMLPSGNPENIPIVPVFVNVYTEPVPSPARCYAFGQMLRSAIKKSQKRVALLATGGLSHYPGSLRTGRIDDAFDRWALAQMEVGNGSALAQLSSAKLKEAGNIELKNWVTMLGALGTARAKVWYHPSLWAITGLAFGYWDVGGEPEP